MKYIKRIIIVAIILFAVEVTTLHMWTHPAFIMILAGVISVIWNKLFSKPIQRRYAPCPR
jgi:hypothetical protein